MALGAEDCYGKGCPDHQSATISPIEILIAAPFGASAQNPLGPFCGHPFTVAGNFFDLPEVAWWPAALLCQCHMPETREAAKVPPASRQIIRAPAEASAGVIHLPPSVHRPPPAAEHQPEAGKTALQHADRPHFERHNTTGKFSQPRPPIAGYRPVTAAFDTFTPEFQETIGRPETAVIHQTTVAKICVAGTSYVIVRRGLPKTMKSLKYLCGRMGGTSAFYFCFAALPTAH